jgi:hypothetical protein
LIVEDGGYEVPQTKVRLIDRNELNLCVLGALRGIRGGKWEQGVANAGRALLAKVKTLEVTRKDEDLERWATALECHQVLLDVLLGDIAGTADQFAVPVYMQRWTR